MQQKVNGVRIGDQVIPWSFIQMVRRAAGGDWDQALDAFWKARNVKGYLGIQKYIHKGILKGWAFTASKERENGQMDSIRDWWAGLYERKKAVMSLKDIFAAIAAGEEK